MGPESGPLVLNMPGEKVPKWIKKILISGKFLTWSWILQCACVPEVFLLCNVQIEGSFHFKIIKNGVI